MKAAIYSRYGTSEVIDIKELTTPIPKDNEVLVNIKATTVSPAECAMRSGTPYAARLFAGLTKPKALPGDIFSGVITAVGKDVTKFKVGDAVVGSTGTDTGSHAEYKCLIEDAGISLKAPDLSFEEGATFADGAITALPFVRDNGQIKQGDHMLINGASGAIGIFAIQFSKYYGAEVTAVSSKKNHALLTSLGADHVIDYHSEDFTTNHNTYDIIFDAVAKSSYPKCKLALKEGGRYMTTVPNFGILLQMVANNFRKKKAIFAATGLRKPADKAKDYAFMMELSKSGQLKTVIDKTFDFQDIRKAHDYVDLGHKVGHVVIKVS